MEISHKSTIDFAQKIIDNKIELTKFEANFVESMMRISRKPGLITLTEEQQKVFSSINVKLLSVQLHSLIKDDES